MSATFDAVIAGGGPAGAAAAIALARRQHTVLLVDPARGRTNLGESLPPAAWPLLVELGVVDRIAAGPHLRSHGTLSSWGADALVPRDFVRELHGHGLQLDRRAFDAALVEKARSTGARIARGTKLAHVSSLSSGDTDGHGDDLGGRDRDAGADRDARYAIRLDGAGWIAARWIIDATGRSASVARQLGARRTQDDALIALVAELRPSLPGDRDSRMIVETAPDGWWYCALTPSGARAVGFVGDHDLLDLGALRSRAGFDARLAATQHLAPRLAAHGYTLCARPRTTAAATSHLVPCHGPRWIAVGDAALAFDPLSSQGIFHALYTGLRGGEAVADALDGRGNALTMYDHRLATIRTAYLRNRAMVYAGEPRWAGHPFWRRRSALRDPASTAVSPRDTAAHTASTP
jgi:flavin-dependent dehydrogenase